MSHADRDIAALVSSRICHDLVSPIGAIANGLELLDLSGAADSPEIALIRDSVAAANARIRFYRIAFGAAPWGAQLASSEIAGVIADHFRNSRIAVDWQTEGEVARRDARLAFLAILCAANALPYGGEIVVRHGEARGGWQVVARSPRLRADPELFGPLGKEGELPERAVEPAHVQFAVLAHLTARRTPPLGVSVGEAEIVITF